MCGGDFGLIEGGEVITGGAAQSIQCQNIFKKEPLNLVFCAKKVNKFTSALPGFDDAKKTSRLVKKTGVRRRKRARGRRLQGRVFALLLCFPRLQLRPEQDRRQRRTFFGRYAQKTRQYTLVLTGVFLRDLKEPVQVGFFIFCAKLIARPCPKSLRTPSATSEAVN